jgi:hypothetical protein
MKRFVAGADRGQHCLPDVACGGHGDQIETADTAVRRIEVKKPLPFAIRRRPTCSASSREPIGAQQTLTVFALCVFRLTTVPRHEPKIAS